MSPLHTPRGRVLGLDVGDRRIGVALSDALRISAQRLTLIERQGTTRDIDTIAALVGEHAVVEVVVGLPLTLRGDVGEQAERVLGFVEALQQRLSCPVHVLDERLTTLQGERLLIAMDTSRRKRKGLIDQIAAQLILQSYLDAGAS